MLVYRERYRKIMYRLIKAMLVYRETWGKIRHRLAKATEIYFWRQPCRCSSSQWLPAGGQK